MTLLVFRSTFPAELKFTSRCAAQKKSQASAGWNSQADARLKKELGICKSKFKKLQSKKYLFYYIPFMEYDL